MIFLSFFTIIFFTFSLINVEAVFLYFNFYLTVKLNDNETVNTSCF